MRKRKYIKQNRKKFEQYMNPDSIEIVSKEFEQTAELAICIPTYERSEVVNELIRDYISLYKSKGYDLYIYDSSPDNKTELVVKKWAEENNNLYYIKMPAELHSNMKVYKIFQQYGLEKKYKYIWVCSDSIRWTNYVWNQLDELMNRNYDMILVNYRDQEPIGSREYTDKLDFFRDCAWHLTLYGATLLNTDRMLKEVDWSRLEKIYNVSDRVNHSHVAFYFEKILCLNDFKAYHWSIPNKCLIASGLKAYSGWRKDTFYVWCYCFPSMIAKLPKFYDREKTNVILKNGKYSDILNVRNLITMRNENLFTVSDFFDYLFQWKRLTDVPLNTLLKIAMNKYQDVAIDNQLYEMNKFCRKYSAIYIYGAGKFARRYSLYLREMGISINGFVVTKLDNDTNTIDGYPVYEFEDLEDKGNAGYILGLGKANQREVLNYLQLRNVDNKNIFARYILDVPYDNERLEKIKKDNYHKDLKELKLFCKQSNKIYIYGIGQCSYRYTYYLKKMGINIEAYVVSEKKQDLDYFNGRRIVEFKKLNIREKDGMILAVNPINSAEIKKNINNQHAIYRIYDKYIIPNNLGENKKEYNQMYFNEQQAHLIEFCKKYSKVYIYGAGKCGLRYLRYFRKNNIEVSGVLVSSKECYWNTLDGIPIYEFDKLEISNTDTGIVLALNKDNMKQVMEKIGENTYNIFSEYIVADNEDDQIVKMRYFRMQTDKMLQFVKKYPNVYIYGAGQCARRYIYYLEAFGVNINGVVVTNKENNPKYVGTIPVYSLDEIDDENKKIGLILALNPRNMNEVKKIIKQKGEIEEIFDTYIQAL